MNGGVSASLKDKRPGRGTYLTVLRNRVGCYGSAWLTITLSEVEELHVKQHVTDAVFTFYSMRRLKYSIHRPLLVIYYLLTIPKRVAGSA